MLRCTVPMILLGLFAIACLVRAAAGAAFAGPAYPDSYYYVNVARELAAGHGLTVDYIWNFVDVGGFLPALPTLPIPSNAHWMPLATIVQVPFIWLLGAGPLVAAAPMWLIGALAAPLTYVIGRDAGFRRNASVAAALLAAVPGGLTPFFGQPDNFGLFMTLGALSLWLCARGLRGDRRAFVAGGVVVGLATLARTDGVLLGLPFALAALADLWPRRRTPRVIGLTAAVACAALFAVVVAPWLIRQVEVFGSIAPSASSGRILWIAEYSELYSIGSPATPQTLLDHGLVPLLASRVGGLLAALGLFALLPLVGVLAPLALLGAWVKRAESAFRPFLIYAAALFGASGLLFAVHVPKGTFVHSAGALLPHTFLLVLAGVSAAVAWVAARRPGWNTARASAIFGYGAVAVALAGAALQTAVTVEHWSSVRAVQVEIARPLAAAPRAERVMSADAGAYRYLSGHPGIVTPNDPLPTIEAALRAYDVRWLALERAAVVPALIPVLTGELQPAWLSRPVVTVTDGAASVATGGSPAAAAAPAGALYAVCFDASDTRCAR